MPATVTVDTDKILDLRTQLGTQLLEPLPVASQRVYQLYVGMRSGLDFKPRHYDIGCNHFTSTDTTNSIALNKAYMNATVICQISQRTMKLIFTYPGSWETQRSITKEKVKYGFSNVFIFYCATIFNQHHTLKLSFYSMEHYTTIKNETPPFTTECSH